MDFKKYMIVDRQVGRWVVRQAGRQAEFLYLLVCTYIVTE